MLGANILVADDDEVSARVLIRLLAKEGCRVRVVQTGEAALVACPEEPPDLVLIDLLTPRGLGFDVCRSLKSRPATRLIPIVIVTARSERRDRLTCIEAGCDDFITKPYDEAELRARPLAHPPQALHRRSGNG
jgi:two-component system phosphate regulon response regulator PhoB